MGGGVSPARGSDLGFAVFFTGLVETRVIAVTT
jgi:hypothetical protein